MTSRGAYMPALGRQDHQGVEEQVRREGHLQHRDLAKPAGHRALRGVDRCESKVRLDAGSCP